MKKILLLLFIATCSFNCYAQLNAAQIKKDGVTIVANNLNQLVCDTINTIPTINDLNGLESRLNDTLGDYLQKANNLSDVTNRITTVANLGTTHKFLATDAVSAGSTGITITDGTTPWEWNLNANDVYVFEAWMVLTTSGSSGVGFRVNAPNDSQVSFSCIGSGGSSSNVSQSTITNAGSYTSTLISYTSSGSAVMTMIGSVICGANGGVINIQYRDNNSGQTVQAKAGGWLRITKIN